MRELLVFSQDLLPGAKNAPKPPLTVLAEELYRKECSDAAYVL